MHEMPYTQTILETAFKEAGDRPIKIIYLRVGELSAILPDSVDYFFNFLKKDTLAKDARLEFEMVPIRLTCQNCRHTIRVETSRESSPRKALAAALTSGWPCGNADFKITDGLSFDLAGIRV